MSKWNLRSLEEDFRDIGLVQVSQKPVQESAREAGEGDSGGVSLDEVRARLVKLRRKTSKDKIAARKKRLWRKRNKAVLAKKSRKWAKSAAGRKFKSRYAVAKKKFGDRAPMKRLSLRTGLDHVSNLIEDVNRIISGIEGRKDRELVRGYANMALVADTFARRFEQFGQEEEMDDFDDLVEGLAEMAKDAADMAERLNAGSIRANAEIEEAFKADLKDLVDAAELYSDLTEEDGDSEDEDEEEDEEEDEDEGNE